ncbi:MAG: hypothetical protein QM802_06450 [Agriterribacter sp.]
MTKFFFFTGLIAVLFTGCKKDDADTPGTGNIVYQKLDSVLGYQQHVTLKIDNDSIADIFLGSSLVMHNNVSHLYLYAATNSKTLHKILVDPGNMEQVNGFPGYPLQNGVVISSTGYNNCTWTRSPYKAILADITDAGDNKVFNGLWKNLEKHYLGIQLIINDKTHFGWICISHEKDTQVLKIHDLAYNAVPDQPLQAGKRS